jgi:hypothetical protein
MYEMFRRSESEFVSGDVLRLTGREPRSVEAYIAEQAPDLPLGQLAGQQPAGDHP